MCHTATNSTFLLFCWIRQLVHLNGPLYCNAFCMVCAHTLQWCEWVIKKHVICDPANYCWIVKHSSVCWPFHKQTISSQSSCMDFPPWESYCYKVGCGSCGGAINMQYISCHCKCTCICGGNCSETERLIWLQLILCNCFLFLDRATSINDLKICALDCKQRYFSWFASYYTSTQEFNAKMV